MPTQQLTIILERILFTSRWLVAPFYIGLVIALVALLSVFLVDLPYAILQLTRTPISRLPEASILMILSIIDVTLAADLMVVVILSGYANFVSRSQTSDDARPAWMRRMEFSNLKMKLISSIVGIAVIDLLGTFLELQDQPPEPESLRWKVILTLSFVVIGMLLAATDFIAARAAEGSDQKAGTSS